MEKCGITITAELSLEVLLALFSDRVVLMTDDGTTITGTELLHHKEDVVAYVRDAESEKLLES